MNEARRAAARTRPGPCPGPRFFWIWGAVVAALSMGGCEETRTASQEAAISGSLASAAEEAVGQNDYVTAAAYYDKLYVRDPSAPGVVSGYVASLRRIGAFDDALHIAEKEYDDHDEDPRFLLEMARAQLGKSKAAEAVETLEKAWTLKPNDWEVATIFGVAYDALGKFEQARASYRQALALSPRNVTILNNLALSMAQSGDIDGAIDLLRDLIATGKGAVPQVRQNLALLYGFKGDLKQYEALARVDLAEEIVQRNLAAFRSLQAGDAPESPPVSRSGDGELTAPPPPAPQSREPTPGEPR